MVPLKKYLVENGWIEAVYQGSLKRQIIRGSPQKRSNFVKESRREASPLLHNQSLPDEV